MKSFSEARRIVVKVGTSTLTYETGRMNIRRIEQLCKVLADLKNSGREIMLVSSGAIAVGVGKLRLPSRPSDTPTKQAAAAVGQCELMAMYDHCFQTYSHVAAQVLLTHEDVTYEGRRIHIVNTISRLLALDTIPVFNENDTVAVEEIAIGDNDTLSAVVAELSAADALVLMSDIDGLYTADPRSDPGAKLLDVVTALTPEVMALGGAAGSERGTGGMVTKLRAAEICRKAGVPMAIVNGENPELLYELFDGEAVGTRFIWED
ncbi:MAG TPA: glutamate 5-kinase [Terriglobales bacterium]|nr:glutamate 5-kinase [Terriglobales bacterium]